MSTPFDWTPTHAEALRDHWWWRPGWQIGTRFYTWHLTFDGRAGVHQLVDQYQSALAGFDGLDLIPRRWLHVVMQGVGHVNQVDDHQIDRVVAAVRSRLAKLDPVMITFRRPVIRREAIALPALPAAKVNRLRNSIRTALAEVLGTANVPENDDGYQPHLSLALLPRPAAGIIAALEAVPAHAVELEVTEASLIIQHRDNQMYEWVTKARAPIAEPDLL